MEPKTNKIEVKVDEHSTRIFVDGVELHWVKSITLHQDGDVPLMGVTIELWTEDAIINGDSIIQLECYQFKGKRNKKFIEEINEENQTIKELVDKKKKWH